jgi:hypothetical protein
MRWRLYNLNVACLKLNLTRYIDTMLNKLLNWFKYKPTTKPNIGKLCDCKNDILYENLIECEYFPLQKNYHTSFVVGKCKCCGGFTGFPHSNLQYAVNNHSDEGKSILINLGFVFDN